jgi:NAD(P)-dependent dehydrogenase (short-subunit alcohol dehydrogenase family)
VNFASFAGAHPDLDVLGLPLDVWDTQARLNERGALLNTRAALPLLLERGGGAIVYTGSGAALRPDFGGFAYAMSKAATHALMRHVALRFGPEGLRANVIAPGYVLHDGLRASAAEGLQSRALSFAAYKRRVTKPEDIAALATLLMADEGATITGQVLAVDGGATMRA